MNVQWQPADEWYGMIGSSVGNGHAGYVPWTDFAWDNWSLLAEFGYAPRDFLGLGPGVYRIQPFVGQAGGNPLTRGFGLNFQQQLGPHSPFGWFGRFGRGGSERFHSESTSRPTPAPRSARVLSCEVPSNMWGCFPAAATMPPASASSGVIPPRQISRCTTRTNMAWSLAMFCSSRPR